MAVAITGTIQDSSGNPVVDAVIRLSPSGATENAAETVGGVGISMTPVEVTTDVTGAFSHTAVDFVRYRLEIPSIGYDRYFVCPDSATTPTVAFNTLGLAPEVQTIVRGEIRVDTTTNTYFTEVTVEVAAEATVRERFDTLTVERSEAFTGPWTTIKTFELIPRQSFYEFEDDTATDDSVYYYRAQYSLSSGSDVSAYSDAIPSDSQDENALLVSVDELRENYLFGLDLTDDDGNPFPDRMLEWYIRAGVDWLAKELDIPLVAKTIEDETHDHFAVDYARWGYFQLQNYPVIAIDRVYFQYPSMDSESEINLDWVVLCEQGAHGVVQIVPGQGNIAEVLMIPGALFPMWSGATGRVPGIWHFKYRAGYEPGTAPPDIKHVIAMWAAIGVLNIAGDLIVGAGIASKSVTLPGLSQNINTTSSATNAGFGARIIEYQKEVKQSVPNLRRYYGKGTRMMVV